MLEIRNLRAGLGEVEILKGIDLTVEAGEIHAVMGPNGSGKSTLAKVLAGHPDYTVTAGTIRLDGVDIGAMAPEERSLAGMFLAYQYPVEVAGVNNAEFLRMAVNARRGAAGEAELDPFDFDEIVTAAMGPLAMDAKFREREVNAGFSGGEKKKNEVLQMTLLAPKLAILDEIDSGLDIDALRVVAEGVNRLRSPDRSMILITHYQRLLDYVAADVIHVMRNGAIVRTGGPELAHQLEAVGYAGPVAAEG
jgi:Fe-S cluster assembly ATP-binding protein